eukprot:1191358-Prorocentrum_minimum.AAC.2
MSVVQSDSTQSSDQKRALTKTTTKVAASESGSRQFTARRFLSSTARTSAPHTHGGVGLMAGNRFLPIIHTEGNIADLEISRSNTHRDHHHRGELSSYLAIGYAHPSNWQAVYEVSTVVPWISAYIMRKRAPTV